MTNPKITSAANPRIRQLVELRKKTKARYRTGTFLIEGTRLCMDTPPQYVAESFVTDSWLKNAGDRDMEKLRRHPVTVVSEEVMAKAADTENPQGILCVARMPSYRPEDLLGAFADHADHTGQAVYADHAGLADHADWADHPAAPLLLILEDIQDPGNLGTMFRTAEAAGATGIIMSRGTVDLFNPKVVRATMSAIFRVPFLIRDDLCAEIALLREKGIPGYAAHLGGTCTYDSLPLTRPAAFLIGNEGKGLSGALTRAADRRIIIPMAGGAESLNAAMAAGILLFEAARQRRCGSPLCRDGSRYFPL